MNLDERAKLIMSLAMGVGITNIESERLIKEKLEEFMHEDYKRGHHDGILIGLPD